MTETPDRETPRPGLRPVDPLPPDPPAPAKPSVEPPEEPDRTSVPRHVGPW